MNRLFPLTLLLLAWLIGFPAIAGDNTGAFVTQSHNGAQFQNPGKEAQPVPAFAKLFTGTKVTLVKEAKLQLVYLDGGRQESWTGPASFKIGDKESIAEKGSPKAKTLPPFMVLALTKSPGVIKDIKARQGMIRVRSLMAARKIREAEKNYARMRAETADDDITPEIYLLTTLDQFKSYKKMRGPLEEIIKRQPNNVEAKELYDQFMALLEIDKKNRN